MGWNPRRKPPKGAHQKPAADTVPGKSRNGRVTLQWRLTSSWTEEGPCRLRRWTSGCAIRPAASIRAELDGSTGWWARAWGASGEALLEVHGEEMEVAVRKVEGVLAEYIAQALAAHARHPRRSTPPSPSTLDSP